MTHKRSTLSAMLLVGGTCIGGGMLALPIATGISGFWPSIAVMALCCFAMTITGLLFLEATLWFEEGAHIITMTTKILGPWGKWISWILFLFISYASLVAYAAGGGVQLSLFLKASFNFVVSKDISCLIFAILFTTTMCVGSWFVGRINSMLFGAMIVAYFLLVGMGLDEVKLHLLKYRNWNNSFMAVPLLLTAFSFQTMVPSLTPYLKKNVKHLRFAIIGGTTIAFLIYFVWFWIILGIVPVDGENGLAYALAKGDQPATVFLEQHVTGVWISTIAEFFAFFAIVTSFLGIALGLYDFLADGLKINKRKFKGKTALLLLMVIPVVVIATKFERVFMLAMDASGGIGDSILNGIIPALLIWRGRYYLGYRHSFKVFGGRFLLALIIAFFVVTFSIEILGMFGFIPSIYNAYDIVEVHNIEEILK